MNTLKSEVLLVGAALVGLYFLSTKIGRNALAGVTSGVVSGAADAASGAVAGVVTGIGDSIGVPRTDHFRCQLAINNGDYFNASKYCTVSELVAWERSYIPPDP